MGLDTPVIHAVNDECLLYDLEYCEVQLTR